MRNREEIEYLMKNAPRDGNENRMAAILEVLLDIRELLEHPPVETYEVEVESLPKHN